MRCLHILIVFWARTLEDEICQLLRKSSNSQGKAHSASVSSGHGSATSATSAASASLRPIGVTCISMHNYLSHRIFIFRDQLFASASIPFVTMVLFVIVFIMPIMVFCVVLWC